MPVFAVEPVITQLINLVMFYFLPVSTRIRRHWGFDKLHPDSY